MAWKNNEKAAKTLSSFVMNPTEAKKAEAKDYPEYIEWKNAFQKLVELELAEIWKEFAKY